jgi:protein-disulfide isomerase
MAKNKLIAVIVGAVLLVIFFIGAYFYKKSETAKQKQTASDFSSSLVREHSPTIGPDLARVTLVEFLDPECESCREFHPIVKSILKHYEGRIKYVVRYAPFHLNSHFAIGILEAARIQNKYWETLDVIFERQPEWGDHHNPQPDKIWGFLTPLNLDIPKIKKEMLDEKIKKNIDIDIEDGVNLNVRATPTFFINGKPLEKFGVEELIASIERELQ